MCPQLQLPILALYPEQSRGIGGALSMLHKSNELPNPVISTTEGLSYIEPNPAVACSTGATEAALCPQTSVSEVTSAIAVLGQYSGLRPHSPQLAQAAFTPTVGF